MRGIEKLGVPELAQRAPRLVRPDHALPELDLVEPAPECGGYVSPSWFGILGHCPAGIRTNRSPEVIDLHREEKSLWRVSDHEDGVGGGILAGFDGVEVDEWNAISHRTAKADVVSMARIRASICVPQGSSGQVEAIGIWPGDDRRDRNR